MRRLCPQAAWGVFGIHLKIRFWNCPLCKQFHDMFGKFRLLDNYLMVGRYVLSTIIYFLHLFLKIKNQNFTPITLYNSKHNLVTSLTKFQIWSHFRFSHLFLSCPYGFTKKWLGKYGGKQSNLWSSQSSSWKPQNSQKRTKKGIGSYQSPFKKKLKEIPTRWVIDTQENCDNWVLKMKLAD